MVALQQRRQAEQMDLPTLGYIAQPGSLYDNDPEVLRAALLNEKMWVAVAVNFRRYSLLTIDTTLCNSTHELCLPKWKSVLQSLGCYYNFLSRGPQLFGFR